MESRMCRICGSNDLLLLPVGQYAEFFRFRVDTTQDKDLLFSRTGSIWIAREPLSFWGRVVRKIRKILDGSTNKQADQFRTFVQCCAECHSITPSHEYTYESLSGLYRDYRAENYNRDRTAVEPSYARMAQDVGSHPSELKNRNAAVDAFFRKNSSSFAGGKMIDIGGSDGRFLPSFVHETFESIDIFDVSDAPLHASITDRKVKKVATMHEGVYSLLTCMHVLEHVGNPKAFFVDTLRHLSEGGLMYIEVPLELTEEKRRDYSQRIIDTSTIIHEHLNQFDRLGMEAMIRSTPGVELIAETADTVDLGWALGLMGRYLVRKTGSNEVSA